MDDVCKVYNYADDNILLNTDHRIDSPEAKLENNAMVATQWYEILPVQISSHDFK